MGDVQKFDNQTAQALNDFVSELLRLMDETSLHGAAICYALDAGQYNTLQEIADRYGVSRQAVHKIVKRARLKLKAGNIRALRTGKSATRIPQSHLQAFPEHQMDEEGQVVTCGRKRRSAAPQTWGRGYEE